MDNSLLEKLKPHWLPISLGIGGLIFLGIGFFVLNAPRKDKPDILFEADSTDSTQNQVAKISSMPGKRLSVDVEGAVEKSGVYELPADARVQDALIAAGGMSNDADRKQVAKGMNLAAKIIDGGKVYIPRIGDPSTASGLASSGDSSLGQGVLGADTSSVININAASLKDLDSLPGIGEATAQKIINNRPYGSIDELLSKKIISAKVFAQIKDKITIY